jgi:hypothetical protein
MKLSTITEEDISFNPLDLIEQLVVANDWAYDRRSDDEMSVEVPGQWCHYNLYFAWRDDLAALHFSCAMNMKIVTSKKDPIFELLAAINEKMWLGHFVYWADESLPMFRHSLLLSNQSSNGIDIIEDLIDIALTECERFFPAFQFVLWGGKSAKEAIEAAMLETVGQA